MKKIKKICKNGHTFYKSSDCLSCPICEELKEPSSGFLSELGSPARNALIFAGIDSVEKLSKYSEKEILKLHGIGKSSLPIFRKALSESKLSFRED